MDTPTLTKHTRMASSVTPRHNLLFELAYAHAHASTLNFEGCRYEAQLCSFPSLSLETSKCCQMFAVKVQEAALSDVSSESAGSCMVGLHRLAFRVLLPVLYVIMHKIIATK